MEKFDIIVVGAGPAGIMAALAAAENNVRIALIDKNSGIGKKLRITGGGRCNLTSNRSIDDFFEKIPQNNKFLYKAFRDFSNKDLLSFFEREGLRFVSEKEKVYPISHKADEVIEILWKKCKEKSIQCFFHCEVFDFKKEADGYCLKTTTCDLHATVLIFAGGGASFAGTGSDFSLCKMLERKGIRVHPPKPSLVRIQSNLLWLRHSAGISLQEVMVRIYEKEKLLKTLSGDLVFTHTGISGPVVLDASAYLTDKDWSTIRIRLDMLPSLSNEEFVGLLRNGDRKNIVAKLSSYLPKNLLKQIYEEGAIDFNNLKKAQLQELVDRVKNVPIPITGLGSIREAIVTRGGVDVKEINPSSMMLRKMEGIFVAGEMIDVDALTGGYNLQIAFSTGQLAGKSAIKAIKTLDKIECSG